MIKRPGTRWLLLSLTITLALLAVSVLLVELPTRDRRDRGGRSVDPVGTPGGYRHETAVAPYGANTVPPAHAGYRLNPTAAAAASRLPTLTRIAAPGVSPEAPLSAARIIIFAVGIDSRVVEVGWHVVQRGDAVVGIWDTVRDAAAHHRGSADPGQTGNCVISGHSSVEGGAIFGRLDQVEPGQKIQVLTTAGQEYTYVITTMVRLDEFGASLAEKREHARWLDPTAEPTLTLVTCWPPWAYTHRLIVRARLA